MALFRLQTERLRHSIPTILLAHFPSLSMAKAPSRARFSTRTTLSTASFARREAVFPSPAAVIPGYSELPPGDSSFFVVHAKAAVFAADRAASNISGVRTPVFVL